MLQCKAHVSRLSFLPIRVRGIFSYPLGKKWLTYISMYHQLSNSGQTQKAARVTVAGKRVFPCRRGQVNVGEGLNRSALSDPSAPSQSLCGNLATTLQPFVVQRRALGRAGRS